MAKLVFIIKQVVIDYIPVSYQNLQKCSVFALLPPRTACTCIINSPFIYATKRTMKPLSFEFHLSHSARLKESPVSEENGQKGQGDRHKHLFNTKTRNKHVF